MILLRNVFFAVLISIVNMFVAYAAGFNSTRHEIGETVRNLVFVFFWCGIFLTIVQMRARAGTQHSFIDAFRNGILFSFLFSIFYTLFIALYQLVIDPQFYATYRAFFEGKLRSLGITGDLLAMKMRTFDLAYNGGPQTFLLLFLYTAMSGAPIAAIAAALFRKPKPNQDAV